jgi:hypothetical protein
MRKLLLLPVVMGLSAGLVAVAPTLSLTPARADAPAASQRPSHIEGRIAFLQAELHITADQMPLWNAVADVLRQNDQAMRSAWADLRQGGDKEDVSALDRLTQMQKMAELKADSLGKLLTAVKPLYAVLSDDQKKNADELLSRGFGRMHHWHS